MKTLERKVVNKFATVQTSKAHWALGCLIDLPHICTAISNGPPNYQANHIDQSRVSFT